MPFQFHTRIVFEGVRGTLAAPRERWAMRLNLLPAIPAGSGAPTPAQLTSLGTAFTGRFGAYIAGDCILNSVKWAPIGVDGKYTTEPVLSSPLTVGGSIPNRYPDQVALAVSLNTATRGPRGKGRFYLPGIATALLSDGLLSVADAQAISNAAAGFVNDINAGWLDNGTVCVASSFSMNSPVTSVRCGRALDTMRSRRASLKEAYVTAVTGVVA